MKQNFYYLLHLEQEFPGLNEKHQQEYDFISSSIFWQLQQADLEFEVATATVVIDEEWFNDYFKKYFKYTEDEIKEVIIAFMKADILEMGVKRNG